MTRPGTDPLLAGLAAGDQQAFRVLYDRYAGRLYGAARAVLGRREDAEDAVQEVFAGVVRSRRGLTEVKDLTAYLFAALRRAAGRVAQRRSREPSTLEAVGEVPARAEPSRSPDPRSERLASALRALGPEQREVIALKIDGQLTFVQIGQVLGTSANTAASRYRYALEKLRRALTR